MKRDDDRDELRGWREVKHDDLDYRIDGQAPVQAEGEMGNHHFYFRSRNRRWHLSVYAADEKVAAFGSVYGDGEFSASWMPYNDAESIIAQCAKRFKAGESDDEEKLLIDSTAECLADLWTVKPWPFGKRP